MSAAEDAAEALRLAREALAKAEAAALAAGAVVAGHVGEDPGVRPDERIRLAEEADGSVGLTFRDQEGRERLRLGLDKHGHPSVELLGPNGGHAGGIG